jgi:hypothetical protein
MWILPNNYTLSSAFAQDMVASKEDLTLPGLNIESSLMWRSKPSPLRTWSQRWKPDSWFPHLFTRILKPSLRKSFEAALISSLAATRASRFQQQGKDLAPKTQDTSGPSSDSTFKQLDLFGACLKTSKDTSALDSEKSLAILEGAGYRTTWGIFSAAEVGAPHQRKRVYILGSNTNCLRRRHPTRTQTRRGQKNLLDVASGDWQHLIPQTWLTPTVQDSKHSGVNLGPNGKRDLLVNQVNWQTPVANDSVERAKGNYNSRGEAKLSAQVKMWPTPRASEAEKSSRTVAGAQREVARGKGADLSTVVRAMHVETFPTPAARDYKDFGPNVDYQKVAAKSKLAGVVMINQQDYPAQQSGSLNPDWVEWLMGVPTGWTGLDSWGTE